APCPVRAALTACQSCQRRRHSRRRHFPDCVVVRVRHVEVARAVHCHTGRAIKPGGTPCPVGAALTARQSCHRRRPPPRLHFPDCVVVRVRHVEVAPAVHCHSAWATIPGATPCPVGAALTARQSCHRRRHSRRRYFPDCVVVCVRHIDVARAVHS